MDNLDDLELIKLVNANNLEAKEELLRRYDLMIYKIVNEVLSNFYWAYSYRDDLIQEARIKLFMITAEYNETKKVKFSTFAYICIKRKVLNFLKVHSSDLKTANTDVLLVCELDSSYQAKSLAYQNPDYVFHINELKAILKRVLNTLPKEQRLIFELYLQQYSYKEIAQIVKVNYKRVDNVIRKIKEKLQQASN